MRPIRQLIIGTEVLFILCVCCSSAKLKHGEHDLGVIRLNFTSCGRTGRNGPSYSDCVNHYKNTENSTVWKYLINHTSSLVGAQFFTVPTLGNFIVEIAGAAGGQGVCSPYRGGGAILSTQIRLESDVMYGVTVGQVGDSPCDGDRFPDLCNGTLSDEECTNQYNAAYNDVRFSGVPPNCSFDGGGGGGGGTTLVKITESQGILTILSLYSAAGGGGSGAVFNGTEYLKNYSNADVAMDHRRFETSNGARPPTSQCPYSGFGGGSIRNQLGQLVDGYPNTLPADIGVDRSYKLGGLGCAPNGSNGGFGGGGGACVSGGGGGGTAGGNVSSYSPYEPGQGGISSINTTLHPAFFTGMHNYRSGYMSLTLNDCGCAGECVKNYTRNVFECLCPDSSTLADDGYDCVRRVYYEKANFSSLPPHYFNSTDSDFGTVDFTVYKFPNSFSFYNIEAVLSTTDRRPARCAVATSYASAYSGVTEIVSVTPNTNNTTKKSSKVQLDVIPVQNSANIVSGIRVLPPETVHNNSIYVSEIAVMSFAPQSHCVLESLNFGQSLKDVFPEDDTNTALQALAKQFLDSFYVVQGGSGSPTDSNDDDNEFPTSFVVAGSIAFVLALILILILTLWLGSKMFSHTKNTLVYKQPTGSSIVPLISSSQIQDSFSPGYETVDGPRNKLLDNQYEVLNSSKEKYDVGNPIVDFYAYNCQRKYCSLESEERWGYPRENLIYLRELGEGQFGKVHLMNAKNICGFKGTLPVAVKVLNSRNDEDVKTFTEEAELMKRFSHPNIVSLLGFCGATEDASPMMILEFMQFGDLHSFMVNNKPTSKSSGLPLSTLYSIAMDVATALDFLSSHRYVHRDVAARNCLVGEGFRVKLADFGLARRMEDQDYYLMGGKRVLPVRWMAPESLVYGLSTSASDVWSYGVLLWELVTYGEMPHRSLNVQEIIQLAEENKLCLERPPGCADNFYDIIRLCQQPSAKNRPSFAALLVWARQHYASSHNTSAV